MLSCPCMARILTDERHWPLVLVVWPEHPVTDEDLEDFFQVSERQLNRGRHVVLHLADGASGLGARHRRAMAAHIKRFQSDLERNVLAGAVVLRNPVLRGMIIATNWLAPPPSPQRIFAHRDAAEAWLMQVLREAGEVYAAAPAPA
ncbi:MAG: hypothetical protein KC766_36925 [Myxococcales bacterium]|nr:hypothetical protein [Myxococcales bacterium]